MQKNIKENKKERPLWTPYYTRVVSSKKIYNRAKEKSKMRKENFFE